MADQAKPTAKPTAKQLRYLRALAQRAGQTFTTPATRAQASGEIDRLRRTPPTSRLEQRAVSAGVAEARPASSVHDNEISG